MRRSYPDGTLTHDAADLTRTAYAAIWQAYNATLGPEDTTARRLLAVALVNMERTTDALQDVIAREHEAKEQPA